MPHPQHPQLRDSTPKWLSQQHQWGPSPSKVQHQLLKGILPVALRMSFSIEITLGTQNYVYRTNIRLLNGNILYITTSSLKLCMIDELELQSSLKLSLSTCVEELPRVKRLAPVRSATFSMKGLVGLGVIGPRFEGSGKQRTNAYFYGCRLQVVCKCKDIQIIALLKRDNHCSILSNCFFESSHHVVYNI